MANTMVRYDATIYDTRGAPRSGASVTVRKASTAAVAPVYSDQAFTALSNPLTSDAYGRVYFYALPDDYTVTVDDTGQSTRAQLRVDNNYLRRSRYVLEEWFQHLPQLNGSIGVGTNLDWEVQGASASNDDVTFAANGGITMETDGGGNDQVILMAHEDATQTAWDDVTWDTDYELEMEVLFTTGAAVTNMMLWFGLKLTNTSAYITDNEQILLHFDTSSDTEFQAISSAAGADDVDDTGITVEASTLYDLRILVDSSQNPYVYLNGALVATPTALTASTALIPVLGVEDLAAAARSMTLHYVRLSRTLS